MPPPDMHNNTLVLITSSAEESEKFTHILKGDKYNVAVFSTGVEALQFLSSEPYVQAVICDYSLQSNFSGIDFAQAFRKKPQYLTVPLIFLSNSASAEEIKNGIMCGADDYLIRPISNQLLLTSVKSNITRAEKISLEREVFGRKIDSQDDLFKEISILNSHHIRGPLSNLMGIIDHLNEEVTEKNEVVNDLRVQVTEIEKIIRMVAGRLNHYKGNKDYRFRTIKNTGKPFKIMFLDDDDIQLKIVRSMIERYYPNVEIEISSLIGHAIDKIQNGNYDLVISDLNMPKISGFEVIDILNQTRPDIPIIILTSSLHNKDVLRAINFPNVYQFLHKPLSKHSFSKIFSGS